MLILVRYFSCAPDDTSTKVFVLDLVLVLVRCSFEHRMLVLMKCFSYTPRASFSEVFLLHTSC